MELRLQKTPMSEQYHPESDETPLLDNRGAAIYRGLIGSANWAIILGRFDIQYTMQAMSRFNMAPQEGHLDAMKRVFGYLKKFPKGRIVINPGYRDNSKHQLSKYENWKEFYPDAEEQLPENMPTPYGRKARITVYVDADHAHDVVTRRSVTAILLFINNTPVRWYSKKQRTVETSTYGAELVAARIAMDMIIEMRFILRMLGVPIDGPALLLGDNNSVVLNTSIPSSVQKQSESSPLHRHLYALVDGCWLGIRTLVTIAGPKNLTLSYLRSPCWPWPQEGRHTEIGSSVPEGKRRLGRQPLSVEANVGTLGEVVMLVAVAGVLSVSGFRDGEEILR
jgi:hypothetical protein